MLALEGQETSEGGPALTEAGAHLMLMTPKSRDCMPPWNCQWMNEGFVLVLVTVGQMWKNEGSALQLGLAARTNLPVSQG